MTLRLGSRGSALALWQAEHVRARLGALGYDVALQVITTTGDRVLDRRLESVGGKGAFLKEIEEALLSREVDLAVHSLKDVPVEMPPGLAICAILERGDARDALVARGGQRLSELRPGARIGTTSLRRQALIGEARPDLNVLPLRGNVDTRLRRLKEDGLDAIVLACAGLERLGRIQEASERLDPLQFIPAPGQGAVAIECRSDDETTARIVSALDHATTARCVSAERSLLKRLGGGCNVPLGAYALAEGHDISLVAFVAGARGLFRSRGRGRDPVALGQAVAEDLIRAGAS